MGKTILQIFVITIFPVIIGMVIRAWKYNFADRAEKTFKIASGIFIFIVILGAILNSRNDVMAFFQETGLPTLILNIITLVGSLIIPRIMGLNFRQSSTISIEAGIQNGTLAITIASSASLLNNPTIAIAPAIYSLIMFATGALVSYLYGKQNNPKAKTI